MTNSNTPTPPQSKSRLHWVAITLLTILTLFWFTFALLSGAEQYGGGLTGLIKNSPNALPWVLAFGLIYLAHRFPLAGGIIFALLGLATAVAFDTYEHLAVFAILTVPYVLLGILLAFAAWRAKRRGQSGQTS